MYPVTDYRIALEPLPAMLLPVQIRTLKRFEFSASRQLPGGRLHGNNFSGWAAIRGPLDIRTGMQMNITLLKQKINQALEDFDHRHLNRHLGLDEPTTLNVALALFERLRPLFDAPIELDELELSEEAENAARVDARQSIVIARGAFSAAHRTYAPRLSPQENLRLYQLCASPTGHGHNYQVELGLPRLEDFPFALLSRLDHRNLNTDIPELADRNVSTETLARLFARQAVGARWARLWETSDFYAEYLPATDRYRLGRRYRFHAAHRLVSSSLSEEENRALYGKCNRPDPHGHTYTVEVSVENSLDPLTETAFDLLELDGIARSLLADLDYTFLDEEVPAFRNVPSTGENIAVYLFEQFERRLAGLLHAVRLWETPNNQFHVAYPHS